MDGTIFLFKVAIKTIKKSKIETEADLIRIRREIQIMSSVQHPNIIHIYEGEFNHRFLLMYCLLIRYSFILGIQNVDFFGNVGSYNKLAQK